MSDTNVAQLLNQSCASSSPYGKNISKAELAGAWSEALKPDGSSPPGKPITPLESLLFKTLAQDAFLTGGAKNALKDILGQIDALTAPGGGRPTVAAALTPKNGHKVFLSPDRGFAVDSSGTLPGSVTEVTATLYDAAGWIQASFGSKENLYDAAALSGTGKRAVLAQFAEMVDKPLSELSATQRDQLLGSTATLTIELLKSLEAPPSANLETAALQEDTAKLISKLLSDERLSVLARRSLVGYCLQSDSVKPYLTEPQKTELGKIHGSLYPRFPVDYAKWDAEAKSIIKIDHVCGQGENFLFGFVKELTTEGVSGHGRFKFNLVNGDSQYGPATLSVLIPAADPMNKWGRDMTVQVDVRQMRGDLYKRMNDASVDIVSYGGHSNFGKSTLQSLQSAPGQVGDKLIARDLCCGVDTKNAEAHTYPNASINSVTSISSSYFRTMEDHDVGKYANESEGFQMLMTLVRGVVGKQDWTEIGEHLQQEANWWGHDSGNNWTWPSDPRAGSFVDDDGDGIPNVFDVLPCYDTTDVSTSVDHEFDMKVPELPASQLSGKSAFQAIQFLNTATNYNPLLQPENARRRVCANPQGLWFDGKDDPKRYVRFTQGPTKEHYLQLSSALVRMSVDTLRAVLYVEFVRYLAVQNPALFSSAAERNAAALVFAGSALEYDDSHRDQDIFKGLGEIYGVPAGVDFSEVSRLVRACAARHNYTGDREAMTALAGQYSHELAGASVGEPAVAVT